MKARSSIGRQFRKREHGAVLVLVAIASVVIFGIVGLSVDIGLALAGSAKQQRIAELAALAAMEGYANSAQDATYDEKIARALDRSRTVSGLGDNLLVVNSFLQDPLQADRPAPIGIGSEGAEGLLTAGRWWPTRAPDTFCADSAVPPNYCGCKAAADFVPCFAALVQGMPGTPVVNAFRMEVKLPDSSLFVTRFARFLGLPLMQFRSQGTAAFVPRRGIFVLDLSKSMTYETHVDEDPLRSMYAFPMHSQFFNHSCFSESLLDDASKPPCIDDITRCVFYGPQGLQNSAPDSPRKRWNQMEAHRPGPSSDPKKHYRDDYRCLEATFFVRDFGTGTYVPRTEKYLIDVYRDDNYRGPEPLNSTLRAIHRAMDRFNQRSVNGDRFAFMGIDSDFIYSDSSGQNQPRVTELILPDVQDTAFHRFGDLYNITDVDTTDSPGAKLERRIREYLIFTRSSGKSNLPAAFTFARQILSEPNPNGSMTSDFVVYFGDGITNCVNPFSGPQCDSKSFSFHVNSLNEVVDQQASDYRGSGITMNVVLLGDVVQPHHLVRTSMREINSCMTAEEYGALANAGHPGVAGGFVSSNLYPYYSGDPGDCFPSGPNPNPSCPNPPMWFLPNRLFEAVSITGGYFFPIQNPCPSVGGAPPGDTCGVQAWLNAQCQARAQVNGPGWKDQSAILQNIVHPDDSAQVLVDAAGRIRCNERCLNTREQIEEAIDKIMGESPFVLVSGG